MDAKKLISQQKPPQLKRVSNGSPSSNSDEQSSNYDSPVISNFAPSPQPAHTTDDNESLISSLNGEQASQCNTACDDKRSSNHDEDEHEHIAPDTTWFHWALLYFPPTLKNAGILLFASGLTLLTTGLIAGTSILITTGTAIAGVGALLSLYGHYNPHRQQLNEERNTAEQIHYPSPASSVLN